MVAQSGSEGQKGVQGSVGTPKGSLVQRGRGGGVFPPNGGTNNYKGPGGKGRAGAQVGGGRGRMMGQPRPRMGAGRAGNGFQFSATPNAVNRGPFVTTKTSNTARSHPQPHGQGYVWKESPNFYGELGEASLTQDGGDDQKNIQVDVWETEADVAHYNTSTRSEDVQKYVTPIPYDSGRTSRVHDQRFNQFGPELTKLGVVQRLAAAEGPIHTVTPQSTVYAASNTGAGFVFNNADDDKHDHPPGGSDTEEAAKPPVVTVGNFSDTDSGSVKSQSASSDGSYESQDSATLRSRLEEMYAMMKNQAKAMEETRKAQELVNEERDN